MPTTTSTLKFLKVTKYNSYMFMPIQISSDHKDILHVKEYKRKEYVFIPKYKMVSKNDLIPNTTYKVVIKDWIWDHKGIEKYCVKYYLTSDMVPITTYFKSKKKKNKKLRR